MPFKTLNCLLSLCVIFTHASSQPISDSAFYQQSIDQYTAHYRAEMGQNSRLFYGPEYTGNGQHAKGSPFFEPDGGGGLSNSVFFNGSRYDNIDLSYDLVTDQLVVPDYSHSFRIALTPDKVKYFTIGHHHFIKICADKGNAVTDKTAANAAPPIPRTGYYEQLTEGSIPIFARREKKLSFPANANEQAYFGQLDTYYLEMNGGFYKADGRNAALDLMKDKRDLLKKFIRDNRLDFGGDYEQALIRLTNYYVQLKK